MYLPSKLIETPQAYGLDDFTALSLVSEDGTHLQAWYHAPKPGYPTVIYFHGNGGNLAGRSGYFGLMDGAGFGVLALDYRGYGASEGSPSEAGFYEDARATMKYATQTLFLSPKQIIIYGESIGTGVAVQMATEYASGALVLQSPFTSIDVLARDHYPWLPTPVLLRDHFDSLSKIKQVQVPLLLFHGEKDTIVPIQYGKLLFANAQQPKESVYFPQYGHLDLDLRKLTETLLSFCQKHELIHGPL